MLNFTKNKSVWIFPVFLGFLGILGITGCAQQISEATGFIAQEHRLKTPKGIGPGVNDLKLSPCACLDHELLPRDASAERDILGLFENQS